MDPNFSGTIIKIFRIVALVLFGHHAAACFALRFSDNLRVHAAATSYYFWMRDSSYGGYIHTRPCILKIFIIVPEKFGSNSQFPMYLPGFCAEIMLPID